MLAVTMPRSLANLLLPMHSEPLFLPWADLVPMEAPDPPNNTFTTPMELSLAPSSLRDLVFLYFRVPAARWGLALLEQQTQVTIVNCFRESRNAYSLYKLLS